MFGPVTYVPNTYTGSQVQVIRGIYNYPAAPEGTVITIGNFDGVHRGHRRILKLVANSATERGLTSCAITFEPFPQEFFRPGDDSPQTPRLSALRDKVQAIAACGIDQLLYLRFNSELAALEPEAFITKVLLSKTAVRHLIVGDDFRFGAKRRGDFALLQSAGAEHGFSVVSTDTLSVATDEGESANPVTPDQNLQRVSSSAIRNVLKSNDCDAATSLLGHPYHITGRVVRGEQIGRTIGFPTANIHLKRLRPALRGVFAVRAKAVDNTGFELNSNVFQGVANLGERPTVGGRKLLLEVNVLNANPDLYGQLLKVEFLKYLRGEKKFDSLDELKSAISDDASRAKAFFSELPAD